MRSVGWRLRNAYRTGPCGGYLQAIGRWLHRVDETNAYGVVDSSMNGGEEVETGEQRSGVAAAEVKSREVLLVLYLFIFKFLLF